MPIFFSNYGAEVWTATYTIKQTQQRGDFWATSVLRPVYLQFYPPEKGQPRTLLEFNYPSEGAVPTLLSLLQSGDPRIEKIKASDPKMADVAARFVSGESNKATSRRHHSVSARGARRYCAAKFKTNDGGYPT